MTELEKRNESLSEVVAKLGYISLHCGDAGLMLILQDLEHDLLQLHHFYDYHTSEGILQLSQGELL